MEFQSNLILVVDTSVLAAIAFGEPDEQQWLSFLRETTNIHVSVASLVELHIVLTRRVGPERAQVAVRLMNALQLQPVPVYAAQAALAIEAFTRFGKGRHPARLNFGDCFSYALAKSLDQPLLFKGSDFSQTDIKIA